MDRREFADRLMGTSIAATLVALLTPVASFLRPQAALSAGSGVISDPSGSPMDAVSMQVGGSAHGMLDAEKVIVIRVGEEDWRVLTATCTHLGCLVRWEAHQEELACPCHGGRYALDGEVLGGPPPSRLQQVQVTREGDLLRRV